MKTRTFIIGLGLVVVLVGSTVAGTTDVRLANAAMNDDLAAVRTLLGQKVDVNAPQGDGMTALHWAAYKDDVNLVKLLLEAGASVKPTTRNGAISPLSFAARNGNAEIIDLLLKAGADVNTASANGTTVLMDAALSGNPEAINLLIDRGADVNAKEKQNGQTAVMFAAWENRAAAIKALAAHKADLSVTTKVIRLERETLDENGNPINQTVNDPDYIRGDTRPRGAAAASEPSGNLIMGGLTAFLIASRDGNLDAVKALIEAGADPNQTSAGDRSSTLVIAIANGHYTVAKYLVDHGADPNLVNIDGLSPLWATANMRYAPVSWAPNPRTDQEMDSLVLVADMLDRGADPNVRTLKRKLWFSPSSHDQTWADPRGSSAFWRAAEASDVDLMKLLVSRGADPNLPNLIGTTPLTVAAGLGWVGNFSANAPGQWMNAVKFCLDHGADINAADQKGYTPLHGAAVRGDNEMIAFLVSKGADVKAVTKTGDTVADMANGPFEHAMPHPDTVAMLEKLGSKNNNNCRADKCVVPSKTKQNQ
jgi:ankyrin repeat protein